METTQRKFANLLIDILRDGWRYTERDYIELMKYSTTYHVKIGIARQVILEKPGTVLMRYSYDIKNIDYPNLQEWEQLEEIALKIADQVASSSLASQEYRDRKLGRKYRYLLMELGFYMDISGETETQKLIILFQWAKGTKEKLDKLREVVPPNIYDKDDQKMLENSILHFEAEAGYDEAKEHFEGCKF